VPPVNRLPMRSGRAGRRRARDSDLSAD